MLFSTPHCRVAMMAAATEKIELHGICRGGPEVIPTARCSPPAIPDALHAPTCLEAPFLPQFPWLKDDERNRAEPTTRSPRHFCAKKRCAHRTAVLPFSSFSTQK
jgi:hypothetical protein